jgi:predicted DNA-binding protein with PD1-like motif
MKTSFLNTITRYKSLRIAPHLGFLMFYLFLLVGNSFAQSPAKVVSLSSSSVTHQKQTNSTEQGRSRGIKVFALRLRPGQDLRKEIEEFVKQNGIKAGFVITTVGSLEKASLRLADQSETTTFDGKFEIVSLVGTLSADGVHLHISLSDNTGRTIGGHLVEGCRIYTTAEIIIGEAEGLLFSRETDKSTGYKELKISPNKHSQKRK